MNEGRFSLVKFYERRARRILPALFLIMLIAVAFAWFWLMPSDMKDFSQSVLATSLFSSNILFWQESSYWDPASEYKPLLHTWSLAVEEQYYVIVPLFLMLLWRFGRLWVIGTFLFVAATSLAVAQWAATHHPSAAFYLLPTRGWELAIGAGIAFYTFYRKPAVCAPTAGFLSFGRIACESAGVLGLVLMAYAIFCFDEDTPFPGVHALVPTLGAGLVILFASEKTLVGRMLSLRPFVFIGLISYSAYLWHQPIFVFTRFIVFPEPDYWVFSVATVVTLALAYLTWRFVESPFRNKNKFSRKEVFVLSVVGSLTLAGVGAFGHVSDGFKGRSWYRELSQFSYQPDNRILQKESWHLLRELTGSDRYGVESNLHDSKLWFDMNDQREKILLVGNSHSKDLYNVLINSVTTSKSFQVARYGVNIRMLSSMSAPLYSSQNFVNADIIIIVSRYSREDVSSLERVVKNILESGKRVVLVKTIVEFEVSAGKTIADILLQRRLLSEISKGRVTSEEAAMIINESYFDQFINGARCGDCEESDKQIEAISKKYREVVVLDRMDYACNSSDFVCYAINGKLEKYYYDYGHHTLQGATFFGARVDRVGWLDRLK